MDHGSTQHSLTATEVEQLELACSKGEKVSDRLLTAHYLMLKWCAENGGIPNGYVDEATAEIGFWALVENRTSPEFAAAMFAQWQDTKLASDGEGA